MEVKIVMYYDTATRVLKVEIPGNIKPLNAALLFTQAATQAMLQETEQRALLVNPMAGKITKV